MQELREMPGIWCFMVREGGLRHAENYSICHNLPENVTHIHITMSHESPVISRSPCMT